MGNSESDNSKSSSSFMPNISCGGDKKGEKGLEEEFSEIKMDEFKKIVDKTWAKIKIFRELKTHDKDFAEFMKRKKNISLEKKNGAITFNTVRHLYEYRDEWTFMNLQEKWKMLLDARREKIEDVIEYIRIVREYKQQYHKMLESSTKQLIKHHNITKEEHWSAFIFQFNQTMECAATETLWQYFAFKDFPEPKLFSKKEMLECIKQMTTILEANKDKIKLMLSDLDSSEKREYVGLWLGEMMAREGKYSYENYLLNCFNRHLALDTDVVTAWTYMRSHYAK
jgi:hypothetical protein